MIVVRAVALLAGLIVASMVFPEPALAWTPGTHVYLGEAVLANLPQLPDATAALLRAFPYDFLYGNIAADTSIAKKYVPVGRHCHSWQVGYEIYDRADAEALRAFGLGYLSHLAADAVAHNYFVPRQLVVTSSTFALGHSYWESRFETHLGDQFGRTAMEVIRVGHDAADAHLDAILAPTIFSVRTSRRLFRGMVGVTETQSWQRVFRLAADASRWDISNPDIDTYMGMSFQYVMELLARDVHPGAHRLDPAGDASLHLAKKMRIDLMKRVRAPSADEVMDMADEHFRAPEIALPYWATSEAQRPWHDHLPPSRPLLFPRRRPTES